MILLITTITIILYIILIAFTVHNLSFGLDNSIKITFVIIGLVIMLIITLVVFHISTNGISIENKAVYNMTRNMLLAVFVPVNGLITMPYVAGLLNKLYSNTISQEGFSKRIIIVAVVFIAIIIFECSYFKSTEQGVLNMIVQQK